MSGRRPRGAPCLVPVLHAPDRAYQNIRQFLSRASLDYTGAINRIVSLYGGGVFLYGKGKPIPKCICRPGADVQAKLGHNVLHQFVLFRRAFRLSRVRVFLSLCQRGRQGTWFRYTYGGSAKDYPGVGADVSAGLAFTIEKKVSLFFEFQGQWGMLIDKKKTDLSGIGRRRRVDGDILARIAAVITRTGNSGQYRGNSRE